MSHDAPVISPSGPESSVAERLDKLYEFERAPVTADRLQPGRYFVALFAGEHVAATEFVIGALFVQWGASARDLILGLLLGNLLAVLSWAFICAPIAVRTRLTLYWYARRIIGPGLTVVYNVFNAVLYACLAAAMIGVSASAVILGLSKFGIHIPHPALTDLYPNSVGWVLVVLAVGAVTVVLAIAGFKKLSEFSGICSPWMFLIFIGGALATLPRLGEVHSLADFWHIAQTKIWLETPQAGTERLSFWHITFFAWFCNLAMHIGLSDMAIFRYAKSWTYGFYSLFGMYLGHYLAWICAGIMGAAVVGSLNPGQMADMAAGTAGMLAVLLAGWTTANPTIYRAGLALQIATPNWPRWLITVIAGGITTIVGFFPAIFMRLLDFVALYGLSLMPIGAIIFTEHWIFPRIGLRQYWAEKRRAFVNLPAFITWMTVLFISFPWENFWKNEAGEPLFRSVMAMLDVHLFFRWLPGYLLSIVMYIVLCYVFPGTRREPGEPAVIPLEAEKNPSVASGSVSQPEPKRPPWTPLAMGAGVLVLLSLLACLALPLWVFLKGTENYEANLATYKLWLGVATIVYFVSALVWMQQRGKEEPTA